MKVENDSVDHKLSYIKSQVLSIIITYIYCSEKFGPLTNLNTKKNGLVYYAMQSNGPTHLQV